MPEYQITSVVTRLRNTVVEQWLSIISCKTNHFPKDSGGAPKRFILLLKPFPEHSTIVDVKDHLKATHHARKPVAYVLDASRHRERWRDRDTHKREGHLPIPRLLDHAYTPGNRQPLPPPHFRLPLPLFPSAGNTNLLQMGLQVVTEERCERRAKRGEQ
jgi:hypothetical protein